MAEDPRSGRFANRSAAAILAEARRIAADIRRRAERDASEIRRDAAEWAATTRREAEEYRERLLAVVESHPDAGEGEDDQEEDGVVPGDAAPAVIDIRHDRAPAADHDPTPPEPDRAAHPPAPEEEPIVAERREFVAGYLAEHRRRHRWRTAVIALVGVALVGAGTAFVATNLADGAGSDAEAPLVDMPPAELVDLPRDPHGRPLADVIADLKESGLDFTFRRVPHEEVPAGSVISMAGLTDASVPRNTVVDLLVSKGPANRTVPDFERGADGDTVVAALEGLGLRPEVRETFHDEVPAGEVVTMSPAGGSSVPRGDTVTVTVSKGPNVVTVPDLAGRSLQQARALLESVGLTTGQLHGHDHGVIVDQRPDAGATVRPGTPVNLRRAP